MTKFKIKVEYNGHVYLPGVEYNMTTGLEDTLRKIETLNIKKNGNNRRSKRN